MADDRVKLSVDEARKLGERALQRLGYDAKSAWIICDHVIDAALCGYEYSGLAKLLNIPEHYRFNRGRGPMKVVRETPVSIMFDGGNENGMLVLYHATEAAIAKAQTHGIALVGVTNTWMTGRSAYYMEMVAKADLVGMHSAASLRVVAPPGAIKPALGTNPIAFGMPSAHGPIVFDMGTSAFMATELQLRKRLNQEIPEGVALDADGNPTRDPAKAMQGSLLTWGGYKGFGLSLMVQALGVFGGSGFDPSQDEGYLIIVFKPDLLCPLDQAKQQLSALIDRIKSTPKAPGVDEIRIPGERSFECRAQLLKEGIVVDRAVVDGLETIRGRNS